MPHVNKKREIKKKMQGARSKTQAHSLFNLSHDELKKIQGNLTKYNMNRAEDHMPELYEISLNPTEGG